ncbi:14-3-3 domain-containing protein [Artemisia annua]|uniref:14-3-3 domain-containing protein n=1 Tax=Artemisia annua TaxID=35608 RepID=A0A2U1PPF2_ARTAN|nr:14-3-3 domain-containing protein [Artemisia annua]
MAILTVHQKMLIKEFLLRVRSHKAFAPEVAQEILSHLARSCGNEEEKHAPKSQLSLTVVKSERNGVVPAKKQIDTLQHKLAENESSRVGRRKIARIGAAEKSTGMDEGMLEIGIGFFSTVKLQSKRNGAVHAKKQIEKLQDKSKRYGAVPEKKQIKKLQDKAGKNDYEKEDLLKESPNDLIDEISQLFSGKEEEEDLSRETSTEHSDYEADRQEATSHIQKVYKAATSIAESDLPPTNPIKVALALNFSIFLYEIIHLSVVCLTKKSQSQGRIYFPLEDEGGVPQPNSSKKQFSQILFLIPYGIGV